MKAVYKNQTVEIIVKHHILEELHTYINQDKRYFIITDSIVHYYYAQYFHFLKNHIFFILTPGEASKSMDSVSQIIRQMLDKEISKTDYIIALGGGVIGDLAGFVASIYKRGIRYINIPTTLIAQVDSSIGGKVGVNFDGFKNQVGSIYHPTQVFIDPECLNTLSKEQYLSGLCEVMKYAILFDKEMFMSLFQMKKEVDYWINQSILYKIDVTTADEWDENTRQILNFGHTIGHAIEAKYGLSHGESIGYGMYFESHHPLVKSLLEKYGFDFSVSFEGLEEYIRQDKKINNQKIKKVKLIDIGYAILEEGTINEFFK
ncbi:MAG: 3-dehydroquinate synthase family protein [Bacilli bacterium]|jgi:3-dehydroquinate synthase|nr:3-dehydroquinate synthase family protein [Bacilli bacterium]